MLAFQSAAQCVSSDDARLDPFAGLDTKPVPPPQSPKVATASRQQTYTPTEEGTRAGVIPYVPGRPIIVNVKLNGLPTVRLLLDTGADTSAVRPSLLEAAGVDLARPATRGEGSVPGGGKLKVSYYTVTLEVAGHRVRVPNVAAISKYPGDVTGCLGVTSWTTSICPSTPRPA